MRSLKINLGGPANVSIDWNSEVSGLPAVAQRAGVSVMTRRGSDKFIPLRGTDVASSLFSYGVADLLELQHLLNFGALKARRDMRDSEAATRPAEDRIAAIKMTLMDVQDGTVSIAIRASNQAGQSSREVLEIV